MKTLLLMIILCLCHPANAVTGTAFPEAETRFATCEQVSGDLTKSLSEVGYFLIEQTPHIMVLETQSRNITLGEAFKQYFAGPGFNSVAVNTVLQRLRLNFIDVNGGCRVVARNAKIFNPGTRNEYQEDFYGNDLKGFQDDWVDIVGDIDRRYQAQSTPMETVVSNAIAAAVTPAPDALNLLIQSLEAPSGTSDPVPAIAPAPGE